MTTPQTEDLRPAWHRFVEAYEPLRPDLHRYCRELTRNTFDAEDLVQDVLMRAFATGDSVYPELRNPRAWLFRVASNLFIDRARRASRSVELDEQNRPERGELDRSTETATASRDGGRLLFELLPPRERAALVLKDVFDMTLVEVAAALTTTVGAVKSALHRAREKLAEEPEHAVNTPTSHTPNSTVEAFCQAFNSRDLDALTQLLLEEATTNMVGMAGEVGRETMRDTETGSLHHTLYSSLSHAVFPDLLKGNRDNPVAELREVWGETVLVIFYDHDEGRVLRDVWRLRTTDDGSAIARIFFYFFCPDVLTDVARELGLPWRSNGYRYPMPT